MSTTFNVQLNSRPRLDGRHLIMIRITSNRKHLCKSIEKYVKKADFNKNAKYGYWIRSSHPEHQHLNEFLKLKLAEFEKSGENRSAADLINTPNGKAAPGKVTFSNGDGTLERQSKLL